MSRGLSRKPQAAGGSVLDHQSGLGAQRPGPTHRMRCFLPLSPSPSRRRKRFPQRQDTGLTRWQRGQRVSSRRKATGFRKRSAKHSLRAGRPEYSCLLTVHQAEGKEFAFSPLAKAFAVEESEWQDRAPESKACLSPAPATLQTRC